MLSGHLSIQIQKENNVELEAYVTIYGWEETYVRDRLNVLETYLNLI